MDISNEVKQLFISSKDEIQKIIEQKKEQTRLEKERKIKGLVGVARENSKVLNSDIMIEILRKYLEVKTDRARNLCKDYDNKEEINIYLPCIPIDAIDFDKDYSNERYLTDFFEDVLKLPKETQEIYTANKKYNENNNNPLVYFEKIINYTKNIVPGIFDSDYYSIFGFKPTFDNNCIKLTIPFHELEYYVRTFMINNTADYSNNVNNELKRVIEKVKKIEEDSKETLEFIKKCNNNLEIVTLEICKKLIMEVSNQKDFGKDVIYTISMPCIFFGFYGYESYNDDTIKFFTNKGYNKEDIDFYMDFMRNQSRLIFFEHENDGKTEYLPVISGQLNEIMRELKCKKAYFKNTDYLFELKGDLNIATNSLDFTNLILNQKEDEVKHKGK